MFYTGLSMLLRNVVIFVHLLPVDVVVEPFLSSLPLLSFPLLFSRRKQCICPRMWSSAPSYTPYTLGKMLLASPA